MRRPLLYWAVLSWGRCDVGKVEIFLLLYLRGPISELLLQCTGTFPLDSWTSTKACLFMGDCLSYCSSGALRPWLRGPGGGFKALSPQGLFADAQMGKTPGALMCSANDRTKAKLAVAKCSGVRSCFWVYSQDLGQ